MLSGLTSLCIRRKPGTASSWQWRSACGVERRPHGMPLVLIHLYHHVLLRLVLYLGEL